MEENEKKVFTEEETCVMCGKNYAIEGSLVCPNCASIIPKEEKDRGIE